jgi:hypothetical protein
MPSGWLVSLDMLEYQKAPKAYLNALGAYFSAVY